LPFLVTALGAIIGKLGLRGRQLHFVPPRFAALILAALEQVARGSCERVVRLAERVDAAVLVVIDADLEPHLRHPLGVAHRAGP
jgi:hypothetical protein